MSGMVLDFLQVVKVDLVLLINLRTKSIKNHKERTRVLKAFVEGSFLWLL